MVHQIKTIKLVELNFVFEKNALFERKSKAKNTFFLTFDLNYAKTWPLPTFTASLFWESRYSSFQWHMTYVCSPWVHYILFFDFLPLVYMYRYLWVWYVDYGFWLLSRRNIISIVWRNWIRLKLISSSYLPIDRYVFSRRPWKYHSARQGGLDWTCFTSLVKFYLVSRKHFHINIS